jgi:YidC/Oxa1 family membrane protein insertase
MTDFLYTLIVYPLTQIIEFAFVFSQKIFKETGISLIFISAVISVLCLPLYNFAEKWQTAERNIQKALKPKIDKIKAVFSGDEQYLILSACYRQNHYHPVYALRSTTGLLIQIPFFIAAYVFLSGLDALSGARFLFFRDLGLPDALIQLTPSFSINVLPILMTGINLGAGVIYARGFPAKEKIQLFLMAGVFLVLLYNSPSGLVIYWTMNNLFSLFKNLYYKIKHRDKDKIFFLVVSLLCLLMAYYILAVHKGDFRQRSFIAAASAVCGVLPWALLLRKRLRPASGTGAFNAFNAGETFSAFIVSFLTLWILTGIFIPSLLIASSPEEFSFIDNYRSPLFFVFHTALQSFGFFIIWPFCLYFLFSPGIKRTLSTLGLMLGFAALCNTFVFPGNYGLVSINMQLSEGVSHAFNQTFLNIIVLICIGGGIIFRGRLKLRKIPVTLLSFSAAALLALSAYNLFTIHSAFREAEIFHEAGNSGVSSVTPLFPMSKTGKNTVVIMLDRASSSFFPYILEESPGLKEQFSGFIYYPNTVSFNGYTILGAPPIFGGYDYTPEEINKRDAVPLIKKHNESLLLLPRLFSEAGFSVTVADPPYPNYSLNNDLSIYHGLPGVKACITDSVYTDLWLTEHNIKLPSLSDILKRDIFWYGLFRVSPLMIRRGLYQYGDWCSSIPGQKLTLMLNGYSVLDYLPRLTNIRTDAQNTVLLMINNTTHDGAFLQEPDYRPVLNVSGYASGPYTKETEYHTNIASYKRLADWFNFLKSESLYDNTRIILVSDHGPQIAYVNKGDNGLPPDFDNLHPILLFKDFDASGSLKSDMTFMTNADVPYLALKDQIGSMANPFTGNEISMKNKEKPLYIAASGSLHLGDPEAARLTLDPKRDYYIRENIFEEKNWSKAE